jgi:hypothetical protein
LGLVRWNEGYKCCLCCSADASNITPANPFYQLS